MMCWIDVETTGLLPREDHLLEVAMVVTDDKLVERASHSVVIEPVGVDIADVKMPLFVREMHEKSGLLADVDRIGVSLDEAEDQIFNWLVETFTRIDDLRKIPLAGSSLKLDRDFVDEHMPRIHKLFHFHSIDVTSITELAARWAPAVFTHRPKEEKGISHRAIEDARISIEYLKYYRASGFLNFESNVMDQAKEHDAYFKGRCPFADCDFCARKK